ncbi:MAG: Leucine Rich repeats (2 copies) [Candidatus Dependentiae bacterium ADurb.Bin331]|nr:MAG: Leucine Rich repeats (2 copies) [Candidatus Dependentiae bacterium ADurb.Bin331]
MKLSVIVVMLSSSIALVAMEKGGSVEYDAMQLQRYGNQTAEFPLLSEESNNNNQPQENLNDTFGKQLAELLVLTNRINKNNSTEDKVGLLTQVELEKYHHELTLTQREIVNFSIFIDLLHCYLRSASPVTISSNDFTLTRLDLTGNQLRDLPPELAQVTTLTSITLCTNRFEKFPTALYGMAGLKKIFACCNQISQFTEEGFAKLKNLEVIDLSNNGLPCVPKTFFTLQNLTSCVLSNNPEIKKLSPAVYKTPPFYFEEPKKENKISRRIPDKNASRSFIGFLKSSNTKK